MVEELRRPPIPPIRRERPRERRERRRRRRRRPQPIQLTEREEHAFFELLAEMWESIAERIPSLYLAGISPLRVLGLTTNLRCSISSRTSTAFSKRDKVPKIAEQVIDSV